MNREDLMNGYLRDAEEFRKTEAEEDKALLLVSGLRLVCFAGGLLVVAFLAVDHKPVAAFLAAVVFTFMFLLLLRAFAKHSDSKELASNLASINQNEAGAFSGDLSKFRDGSRFINNQHDFSYDIDLFGSDSLFQYLNRTVTSAGEETLAGWLSDPFLLSQDLVKRQEIIRELADHKSFRQHFMAAGMKVPVDSVHSADLLKWMCDQHYETRVRKFLIFFLPALTIAAIALVATGLVHYTYAVLLILINLGYVSAGLQETNAIHRLLSGKYEWLSSVATLVTVFGKERFRSAFLSGMQEELSGKDFSAAASVANLGKIIRRFDSRLNMIAGFLLNALLLWDFHCIRKLGQWKRENDGKFSGWLRLTGDIDAYSSLANYSFNNGKYAWPSLSSKGALVDAREMGHPLIPEEKRVCNDFSVAGPGNICIITGANMAGKSTFLRTAAVNIILAMTGAPVCAASFEFTPVRLFTSMRTTDSLSGNESYFYAELKRLRTLSSRIAEDKRVFFILDEILKGTNSADKALGSKLFLKKLIGLRSAGMIATHDISLADLEKEHPESVFNSCFEIEIDGEKISFDYKLRPGITRKMNAALLMRQMGILD